MGGEGDRDTLLARTLATATNADKVAIAAQLGDLQGEAGTAALREAVNATGPGTRDLRCAALLALAKRCGVTASPWLRDALRIHDGAVREYAVIGLAGAGDDEAWDDVADLLSAWLRKTSRYHPGPVPTAVAYLGQHVQQDADRRRRLVAMIRRHWTRRTFDDRQWFVTFWPAAAPEGPPIDAVDAPDADALRAWVRTPLFEPL